MTWHRADATSLGVVPRVYQKVSGTQFEMVFEGGWWRRWLPKARRTTHNPKLRRRLTSLGARQSPPGR